MNASGASISRIKAQRNNIRHSTSPVEPTEEVYPSRVDNVSVDGIMPTIYWTAIDVHLSNKRLQNKSGFFLYNFMRNN